METQYFSVRRIGEHEFVCTPYSGSAEFGVSKKTGKAFLIVDGRWSNEEWLEAMRLHSAIVNCEFNHLEIGQKVE